jgi:spermidine/putrescine transport system substrate-binding protein
MKRFFKLFVSFSLLFSLFSLYGEGEVIELKVYNWEDYISIDDGSGESVDLIKKFEQHCKEKFNLNVKVKYSTFGTLENMYNELMLTRTQAKDGSYTYAYDLVCPSDYMVQKMILEGMVEKYDYTIEEGKLGYINGYYDNASKFIVDLFKKYGWQDYATGYMWGTMGFVYNPEVITKLPGYTEGDENHWSFIWKEYVKNLGTIKDSIRDTYALALGYVYSEELATLRKSYESKSITKAQYTDKVVEIFNRTDEESVNKVEKALSILKENIYGFEVDSGKKDMATGKIAINFAWSGDAVYTLDTADEDENGAELYYAVPEEGSNIWFDGWVMPKGANVPLAQEFINFLAQPENAKANMDFIGYTSVIAGNEMFENCVDNYGTYVMVECEAPKEGEAEKGEEKAEGEEEEEESKPFLDKESGKYYCDKYVGELSEEELNKFKNADGTYNFLYPDYDKDDNVTGMHKEENVTLYKNDLNYFFANKTTDAAEEKTDFTVITDVIGRQCSTQYPTEDIVARCAIMKHFDDEQMLRLNNMWDEVKVSSSGMSMVIPVIIVVLTCLVFVVVAIMKRR